LHCQSLAEVLNKFSNIGKRQHMRDKIKVLIVEDELQLACLMVRVLTRIGCDVEAAFTGKKAVELATEMKFDLIALDIELSDASSLSVCSKLKERHISRNTPILFISSKLCQSDIEEGRRRGAVDFITKPFDVTELIYHVIFYAKVKANPELKKTTEIEVIAV
jgi:DNA-binding response OmpR family regulator